MQCLIIFSILTISIFAAPSKDIDPVALQIAKDLENNVAKNALNGNMPEIAEYFADDFKHKMCDGTVLTRAQIFKDSIERKTVPEPKYISAKMISDSEMYYVVEERFLGKVFTTKGTLKNIGGKWRIIYGEGINCK